MYNVLILQSLKVALGVKEHPSFHQVTTQENPNLHTMYYIQSFDPDPWLCDLLY